ncbi:MAG: D-alanyl-D-alanine carboxypeptidase, partial [Clostridiales bacterium]|nr:D-alanyl-D-alanine carboxypeptidase [Clostridiales bacterium]
MKVKKGIMQLFLLLTILCLSFSSVALGQDVDEEQLPNPTLPPGTPEYNADLPDELLSDQLYASSAILIEYESGNVIFEKNADEIMHPASTTKILTVYLASIIGQEQNLLNETVYASEEAIHPLPEDSSLIPLKVGESINYKDLLFATMVRSGNDGANVLAEAAGGSIESFVSIMNDYVASLGLTNTHFVNTHGYTDPSHYTTARDMAAIAREALSDDLFRQTARLTSYSLPQSNETKAVTLNAQKYYFLDPESKYFYPSGIGIKTGTTTNAGYCFVGAAEKDGVTLISVVLYSGRYSRWEDTKKLMDYGFSQYVSTTPMKLYQQNPLYVNVSG